MTDRNYLTIKVRVEPRSSRSGIVGFLGDALKVKLNSPPTDGKANKELVKVLSSAFRIPKRDVEIISGHASKNKMIRLHGVNNINDWQKR